MPRPRPGWPRSERDRRPARPAALPGRGWPTPCSRRSGGTGEFTYFPGDCGIPFGAIADALLHLGPVTTQTQSLWNPATYLDPTYWTELQRRKTLTDAPVDLDAQYRHDQPVAWPTPPPPTC